MITGHYYYESNIMTESNIIMNQNRIIKTHDGLNQLFNDNRTLGYYYYESANIIMNQNNYKNTTTESALEKYIIVKQYMNCTSMFLAYDLFGDSYI